MESQSFINSTPAATYAAKSFLLTMNNPVVPLASLWEEEKMEYFVG